MALQVIDGGGTPRQLKATDDGGALVPHQRLDALPGTVEADIGSINTFLNTLAGAIAAGRMAVDLSAAVLGYLAKLDLLSAPTVYYEGNKSVNTPGTRVQLAASQALTKGVWAFAKEANVGLIYIGGSSVSSSAGGRLVPGACLWLDASNLASVWLDAANANDGVTYLGW